MADLSRAHGRQTRTPVLGWDGGAWVDTGLRGRLQVYDRFISDRDFGQRKRILSVAGNAAMPEFDVVRLEGDDTAYMIESAVRDLEDSTVYATIFSLHTAAFPVQVCKMATAVTQSGVKRPTGEKVLAETWVDITRYSAVDSREFQNSDFTIYTVYFPRGTPLDTDSYVKRTDTGEILDINEVFQALEIPAARCQRRG